MGMNEGLAKLGQVGGKVRNIGIFLIVLGVLAVWAPQVTGKGNDFSISAPYSVSSGLCNALFSCDWPNM